MVSRGKTMQRRRHAPAATSLRQRWLPLVLASLTLAGGDLHAGDQSVPREVLIVTGVRVPTAIAELASNGSVIDRERIATDNPTSITDVLRRLDGVHLTQPGGRGGVASLFVRGAEANFMPVFIDGVQVNDPTTPVAAPTTSRPRLCSASSASNWYAVHNRRCSDPTRWPAPST